MSTLLNCPFCGSDRVELRSDGDFQAHPFYVHCDKCGAATQDWADAKACAAHWNTRAPRPSEGAIDEGAVESLAQEIYKRIPFDGPSDGFTSKPAWIVGGNSIRQDDARTYARTAIKFLSAAAIGTGGQWISVKERMPELGERVLTIGRDEESPAHMVHSVAYRTEREDGGDVDGWIDLKHNSEPPTHWQPLPSPPSQRGGDRT